MKESRLFQIVYYLLEKGKSTAPELSEKFEVSIRTIYRDIDALSSAGIPIYAAQGKNGGIFLLDHFTLDKSLLSKEEKEQIINALQGITAAAGKTTDALLTKLSALFQTKSDSWIEVDFSDWRHCEPEQDLFHSIKNAIWGRNVVSITYFDSSGHLSARHVHPYKLIFKSKDWYLYGFCLLKQDYRYFKLTRIQTLEILSETYLPAALPPVLPKQIKPEKTIHTRLKFDRQAAFRVYDEFTDEVTVDKQGNLYVETDLPDNDLLYSYLFSFAGHVEVIEPELVRERIQNKLKEILSKYRT